MKEPLSKFGIRLLWTLRIVFALLFLVGIVWVLMKTIFPNGGGFFDFTSYGSGKNTLADPRYNDESPIEKGILNEGDLMTVNASALGDFLEAKISFEGRDIPSGELGTLSLLQSYRAYFYPLGDPVVCPREGSLLATKVGAYMIVSGGALRPFLSEADVVRRGYQLEQFAIFQNKFLIGCPREEPIVVPEERVEGMIVRNDEGFFQFQSGEWVSFISESAFHSRYRDSDTLFISQEDFSNTPVGEKSIGYLDGVLVSYGESVYAVEGETLRPIDSEDTFISKGYRWEDIIPLNGEEFGMYTRGKLYTKRQPHPNGTLFLDEMGEDIYLVENGKKRKIISPEIQLQFSPVHPIQGGIANLGECNVIAEIFSFGCVVRWTEKDLGVGAEYQISYKADSAVQLTSMRVDFFREKNMRNAQIFMRDTLGKLKSRYSIAK